MIYCNIGEIWVNTNEVVDVAFFSSLARQNWKGKLCSRRSVWSQRFGILLKPQIPILFITNSTCHIRPSARIEWPRVPCKIAKGQFLFIKIKLIDLNHAIACGRLNSIDIRLLLSAVPGSDSHVSRSVVLLFLLFFCSRIRLKQRSLKQELRRKRPLKTCCGAGPVSYQLTSTWVCFREITSSSSNNTAYSSDDCFLLTWLGDGTNSISLWPGHHFNPCYFCYQLWFWLKTTT